MSPARAKVLAAVIVLAETVVAIPLVSVGQTGRTEGDAPGEAARRCKLFRTDDGRLVKRCRRVEAPAAAPQMPAEPERRCKLLRTDDGRLVKRCRRVKAPAAAAVPGAPAKQPAPGAQVPAEAPPVLAPVPPGPGGPPPALAPIPPEERPFQLPGAEEPPPPEPPGAGGAAPAPGLPPIVPPAPGATSAPAAPGAPGATTAPAAPAAPGATAAPAGPAPEEEVSPGERGVDAQKTRPRRRCKRVRREDGSVVLRCKRIRPRPSPGGAGADVPGRAGGDGGGRGRAGDGGVVLEEDVRGAVGEGPRFQGGWRLYFLTDYYDEGTTNAFDLTIYPLQGRFRLGFAGEVGIRDLSHENDILVRGYGTAGYQHPGRWTPFVVALIGGGAIAMERFEINTWGGLFCAGIEGGVEARLGDHALLGATLGLQRTIFAGAMYDSLTLRASFGF